jgi:hypothetical protein
LGVPIVERDRRTSEGDERGVRQGVADVPGVPVQVVVVAAMRLVRDDDDVVSLGPQRVVRAGVALFLGTAELLQCRVQDPAGGAVGERVAKPCPGRHRLGSLAEKAGLGEALE